MFNRVGGGDEGRCFRKVTNKAVVKSRTEMEQMLEAKKQNKQRKQEIGYKQNLEMEGECMG